MTIQEQVCLQFQSIRLKELGVVQKSAFYYHNKFERAVICDTIVDFRDILSRQVCNDKENAASAYSVPELIAALPPIAYGVELQIHIKPEYVSAGYYMVGTIADAMTVAEALAIVLILMLENGDTTIEEVNQRLTQ